MFIVAALAAALTAGAPAQQAPPPLGEQIAAAQDQLDWPKIHAGVERNFKEAGISPVGVAVLMSYYGRSAPNQTEQAAFDRMALAIDRWQAIKAQPSLNAIDAVAAARAARAATRANIDLLAAGQESLLLQLSPADLKKFLDLDHGSIDKVLLGMF